MKITANDDWWADEVQLADPAENRRLIEEAVAVARGADQIVLAIGDTEQTSREGWAKTHLGDRDSLDLVGEQQALFDALHALGKPIVVVLINGRPASTVTIAAAGQRAARGLVPGRAGRQCRGRRLVRRRESRRQIAGDHSAQRRPAADVLQRQALGAPRLPVRHASSRCFPSALD